MGKRLRLLMSFAVIFWIYCAAAQAGDLRAGAGKVSITPTKDEFPYTARGERSFVGVHDDVYARALVLDDGERRTAIISLEVTAVPDSVRLVKAVAQEVGVPETNIMVAATHTHNVLLVSFHGGKPDSLQAREMDRLRKAAVEAAHEAVSNLKPAQIAFGRGEAWVNVNNGEQAGFKDGYDPNGPSDKTLDVLRLEGNHGEPIALLVNYSSHAEVMFRSATKDAGYEISGDLPGAAAQILEGLPAAAPVVLFSSGAEADQLPLFKSLQHAALLPDSDEGSAGWALLDAQARRLSSSVMKTLAGMKPGIADVRIETSSGTVTCPGKQLSAPPERTPDESEQVPRVAIPIAVIRINDILLAGVGGDVASEIGRKLKEVSPVAHTTLISMTAGSVGYILTDASYVHQGHGVMGSPLKAGCAEHAVIEGLLGHLKANLE